VAKLILTDNTGGNPSRFSTTASVMPCLDVVEQFAQLSEKASGLNCRTDGPPDASSGPSAGQYRHVNAYVRFEKIQFEAVTIPFK
jgi:hypothetical protein